MDSLCSRFTLKGILKIFFRLEEMTPIEANRLRKERSTTKAKNVRVNVNVYPLLCVCVF